MEVRTEEMIDDLNARFDNMTNGEKLVEICRDILRQLANQNIRPAFGSYITGELPMSLNQSCGDAQVVISELQKSCRVCMLGAMVLSKIRLFDRTPVSALVDAGNLESFTRFAQVSVGKSYCRIRTQRDDVGSILDFIPQYDADRLEAAYENSPEIASVVRRGIFDAAAYCANLVQEEERMAAIATRVISKRGVVTFPESTSYWLRRIKDRNVIGWFAPLFYGKWFKMPPACPYDLTIIACNSSATDYSRDKGLNLRVVRTNTGHKHPMSIRDTSPEFMAPAADNEFLPEAAIVEQMSSGELVSLTHKGCDFIELENRVINFEKHNGIFDRMRFEID